MDTIFQLPGYITKDRSLSGGGRQFTIETQENLTPEHLQRLINLENKLGWFTFNVTQIEAVDLLNLPKIDKSKYMDSKTPSQRLRSVLWLLFKQENPDGNNEQFNTFYDAKMEQLINWVKDKLT